MKKLLFLLVFAGLLSASSTLLGGQLSLNTVSYLPLPAQPGEYIDLFAGLANTAGTVMLGVQCKLEPEFPFSLDENEKPLREIGDVASRQSFVLKYKIRVNENAVAGDNELKISCKTEGADWITGKMSVFVQPSNAVLSVNKVEVSSADVRPGGKAKVTAVLKNEAKTYLKNIALTLLVNTTDLPFAPSEGSSQKRISLLAPGEEVTVEFGIVSSSDAELKVYKIPLQVSYYDSLGTAYSESDLVGVVVGGKPQLLVSVESDPLKMKALSKVSIRLSNAGISDAKFLTVKAMSMEGAKILANQEEYLGTISSDNYETVTFQMTFNAAGEYSLPIEVKYKDSNNNDYAEQKVVPLRVYSQDEAYELGLDKRPDYSLFIIVGILVIGYLAYRFLKKKHKV
ncbi:hypothetical protein HZC09_02405 [Candidatus Micrarchaeota archaeon]|nr:hypothetical protein [Candidatus Micrarchaeota archaeon]